MKAQTDLFDDELLHLNQLQEDWKKTIKGGGGHCPICERWGKVNKYKMTEHLALSLRWIHAHGDTEGWVNVQKKAPRWIMKSKTYNLLEHWGLLESRGFRTGIWRVTNTGRRFIYGEIRVPSAVYVYDNIIWGVDEQQKSFRSCFGVHFDFDELMSSRFDWSKVKGKNE